MLYDTRSHTGESVSCKRHTLIHVHTRYTLSVFDVSLFFPSVRMTAVVTSWSRCCETVNTASSGRTRGISRSKSWSTFTAELPSCLSTKFWPSPVDRWVVAFFMPTCRHLIQQVRRPGNVTQRNVHVSCFYSYLKVRLTTQNCSSRREPPCSRARPHLPPTPPPTTTKHTWSQQRRPHPPSPSDQSQWRSRPPLPFTPTKHFLLFQPTLHPGSTPAWTQNCSHSHYSPPPR